MAILGYAVGAGNWNGQEQPTPQIPQTGSEEMAGSEAKNIFWELMALVAPAGEVMLGKTGNPEFISNGKEWVPYEQMRFPDPLPGDSSESGDGSETGEDAGQGPGRRSSGPGGTGRSRSLKEIQRAYNDLQNKMGQSYRRFEDAPEGEEDPGPGESKKPPGAPKLPKKTKNKTPGGQTYETRRDIFVQLRGVQFALDVKIDKGNMLPEELRYPECLTGDGIVYGYLATGTTIVPREPKDREPRKFRLKSFSDENYGTIAIYREIKPKAGWL